MNRNTNYINNLSWYLLTFKLKFGDTPVINKPTSNSSNLFNWNIFKITIEAVLIFNLYFFSKLNQIRIASHYPKNVGLFDKIKY